MGVSWCLNKVPLSMCEYALIMLNMIEYASINLKKQSAEYHRILNESRAVHTIRSLQITEQLSITETDI